MMQTVEIRRLYAMNQQAVERSREALQVFSENNSEKTTCHVRLDVIESQ
jgi:hypothetical protein